MALELVINSKNDGVDVALLKDKRLIELHKEKNDKDFTVGDVFLGKVKRVIPSLNAAFVDVGYEKDAFLHYLDLGPQFSSLKKMVDLCHSGKFQGKLLDNFKLEPDIDKKGKIKDVIKSGQLVMVQIAKEPISSKGPRLAAEVTLAGRYLVLVPFTDKISISQKIGSNEEKKRLKRLVSSITPKNFGVIIRTVAENKKVAELDQDLRNLIEKWDKIQKDLKGAKPRQKLMGELSRTSSILRDMLNPDFEKIVVNNAQEFEDIKEFIERISPGRSKIVKQHSERQSLFEAYGINKQIKLSFGKQVPMKSGAYLIIEHTEAMHVIDVNSGNRVNKEKSQAENAFECNMEAAEEIARVLRLRDMGGIISVDFIDMPERENQKKLYQHLRECMKDDRAKHHVLPPSKFGVVEITRQRVRPETNIETSETCPTCNGNGKVTASILIIDEIESAIRFISQEKTHSKITIKVHPFIEAFINKKEGLFNSLRKKWMKKYGLKIEVLAITAYPMLAYKFYDKNDDLIKM